MKTVLNLDSPIFTLERLRGAANDALTRTAKEFKDATKQKMVRGPHTGRLYRRKRGQSFRRSHRASAPGQRPSPDTGKLLNSVSDKRVGELTHEVSANTPYAPILQDKLDRPIMDEQDAREAEAILQQRYNEKVNQLI